MMILIALVIAAAIPTIVALVLLLVRASNKSIHFTEDEAKQFEARFDKQGFEKGAIVASVDIFKNGELESNHNDPSDAFDHLIDKCGCPADLFLRDHKFRKGYSWNDLPIKFVWKTNLFEVKMSK